MENWEKWLLAGSTIKTSALRMPKLNLPFGSSHTDTKPAYQDADFEIWQRYKNGDQEALWELLDKFKGMITQVTLRNTNVLPKQVVEAEAKRFAIQAFDSYKPGKNTKLATHVFNYLRQVNRLNYKNQQAIKLPENYARAYTKYNTDKAKLSESLGREPTTIELADYIGWSPEQVARAEKKYHKELAEGKQEFEMGTVEPDTSASAIRYAYQEMTDEERYLFEHKVGYMGKRIYPMGKIREDLKMPPYRFTQLQKSVNDKLRNSVNTLNRVI